MLDEPIRDLPQLAMTVAAEPAVLKFESGETIAVVVIRGITGDMEQIGLTINDQQATLLAITLKAAARNARRDKARLDAGVLE